MMIKFINFSQADFATSLDASFTLIPGASAPTQGWTIEEYGFGHGPRSQHPSLNAPEWKFLQGSPTAHELPPAVVTNTGAKIQNCLWETALLHGIASLASSAGAPSTLHLPAGSEGPASGFSDLDTSFRRPATLQLHASLHCLYHI